MIAGVLAFLGAMVAVAILASRSEALIERFWFRALAGQRLVPALLSYLGGIEQAIRWTREQVGQLRAAGRSAEASDVDEKGHALERGTRQERRRLGRLRQIEKRVEGHSADHPGIV